MRSWDSRGSELFMDLGVAWLFVASPGLKCLKFQSTAVLIAVRRRNTQRANEHNERKHKCTKELGRHACRTKLPLKMFLI